MGLWRRVDGGRGEAKEKEKDVLTGVDFEAREREVKERGVGMEGEEEEQEEEEEEEEDWRFAIVLDGHESEVKSVSWSSGGNLLATCSRDKSVWVWEEVGEDDYETVAVLQEHEGDVKCVAWHPEEELVASGSYDDEVRLWREDVDDWGCCCVLRGHGGTVWCVGWEGVVPRVFPGRGDGDGGGIERGWVKRRELAGPRLISCSDDLSIRVWRRRPREKVQQSRLSIIRSGSSEEDWVEEARLPRVHSRSVYAVAWGRSGRVVSTGGDGAVVVYEERWRKRSGDGVATTTDAPEDGVDGREGHEESKPNGAESVARVTKETASTSEADRQQETQGETEEVPEATEWVVIAQIEGAHGVFEVNHVAWAPRRDKNGGGTVDDEEVIVTTGDDGTVKVWTLDV